MVTNDKKEPKFFSMLHFWMKKKYPKGVFLVKFYTGSVGDLLHYPDVFEGFKDYDEAFDFIEEKGFLDHEDYILKIYVDGKKSEEGDDLIEGKVPSGSKRYVHSEVETKLNKKKGKYNFVEAYNSNTPSNNSYFIVFPDKSYVALISFDDVHLNYNAMDNFWGLSKEWIESEKSQEKKEVISKAKYVINYAKQHEDDLIVFLKENTITFDDLMEKVTNPAIQSCINLHMKKKGVSDDREEKGRIEEVNYLRDGNPEGWNYCIMKDDVIKLALSNAPVEEMYSLLKRSYIPNLVEL